MNASKVSPVNIISVRETWKLNEEVDWNLTSVIYSNEFWITLESPDGWIIGFFVIIVK